MTAKMPPIRRLRESLRVFADTVGPSTIGHTLAEAQERAFDLDKRHTAVIAPRQSGKSDALALLAAWHAFGDPRRAVLVVSASEDSARRLLGRVRMIVGHDLLRGSVIDEQAGKVVLSNGSIILSVPASERAIRGSTSTLLIIDEAAMVSDDIALSAALPTVAARPEAHVVACSTPWTTSGWFYDWCMSESDYTSVRSWSVADASWLGPSELAALRDSLGPERYAIEVECQWRGRVNAVFSPDDLLKATCDYTALFGGTVSIGADWSGQSSDPHAVVALGVADDHEANEQPVVFVAVADSQHAPYAAQIEWIASLGQSFDIAALATESVGVGSAPSESLRVRMGSRVRAVATSQRIKEAGYSTLQMLLVDGRLVLPAGNAELLRQFRALAYETTPSGGMSIAGGSPSIHDDLADAAMLAALGVTFPLGGLATPEPPGMRYVANGFGIRIPRRVRARGSSFRPHGAGTLTRYGGWSDYAKHR